MTNRHRRHRIRGSFWLILSRVTDEDLDDAKLASLVNDVGDALDTKSVSWMDGCIEGELDLGEGALRHRHQLRRSSFLKTDIAATHPLTHHDLTPFLSYLVLYSYTPDVSVRSLRASYTAIIIVHAFSRSKLPLKSRWTVQRPSSTTHHPLPDTLLLVCQG
jgi:hypothetical protein